jgi:hypothetical protein
MRDRMSDWVGFSRLEFAFFFLEWRRPRREEEMVAKREGEGELGRGRGAGKGRRWRWREIECVCVYYSVSDLQDLLVLSDIVNCCLIIGLWSLGEVCRWRKVNSLR